MLLMLAAPMVYPRGFFISWPGSPRHKESPMSKITFRVDFASSFRRGINCPIPPIVTMEVDPAKLPAPDRDLLASRLNSSGDVCSVTFRDTIDNPSAFWLDGSLSPNPPERTSPGSYGRTGIPSIVTANEPTLAGVLEAIREEDAKISAKVAKKIKERNDRLDLARAWAARGEIVPDRRSRNTPYYTPYEGFTFAGGFYSSHYDDVKELPEVQAYLAKVQEADNAAFAEHLRRIAQRQADEIASQLSWIQSHGSPRLKRLVAEGIDHAATYTKEHDAWEAKQFDVALTAERPGWRKSSDTEITTEISDVTNRAFALLDAARKLDANAKLAKLRDSGKYVAYSTFMGVTIVWPQD
jgi:hypothetical protein